MLKVASTSTERKQRYRWVDPEPQDRGHRPDITFELVDAADFDAAYDLLADYFLARGEMEPRDVLRRLVAAPWERGPLRCCYEVVVARRPGGDVVAVSDLYLFVDRAREVGLNVLSNIHVAPGARSGGIGTLFDLAIDEHVRDTVVAAGLPPDTPRLISGDVEAIDIDDLDTLRRLFMWSRRGFRAIPHSAFPLRYLAQVGADGRRQPPGPALLIIRQSDEPRRIDHLRRDQLELLVDAFAAIHAAHLPDEPGDHAAELRQAAAAAPDAVALLPLPGEAMTIPAITPLLRSVAYGDNPAPEERELQWLVDRFRELGLPC